MKKLATSLGLILVLAICGCSNNIIPTEPAGGKESLEKVVAPSATGGHIFKISPTGTPVDLVNVRSAVAAAQPGDVIPQSFKVGRFCTITFVVKVQESCSAAVTLKLLTT